MVITVQKWRESAKLQEIINDNSAKFCVSHGDSYAEKNNIGGEMVLFSCTDCR